LLRDFGAVVGRGLWRPTNELEILFLGDVDRATEIAVFSTKEMLRLAAQAGQNDFILM